MKRIIKTSVLLSSISLGVLHLANRFITAAATVRELLNHHSGTYYEWRFGKIYYTKTGSGSPLLLLHDTDPMSSSYEWNEVVRDLSKDHTVYACDLLGCGRSDKPSITYTNFLYVQMISDFVKNVIGGKTDVAATGLTCSSLIMACFNDSDLFRNLVLVNPESPSKLSCIPGKNSKIRKFVVDLPIVGTSVYHMLTRKENVEYLFSEKYFYNPFKLSSKYTDIYFESAHLGEAGGKYLFSSMKGLYLNININKAVSEINNNIILIAGRHCNSIEHTVDEYTTLNPAVEVVYIDDAKYLPQLEDPEEFYDVISIL
jgi:pimeloyl-ACP methyl ester carboxylesterase